VNPDFVGHGTPKIVMGEKSEVDNVAIWSQRLGIELNEEESLAVLKEVKLRSHDLKRVLTEDEFKKIVEKVKKGYRVHPG
jgi:isopropylmalate/homocitrate/citramalate synthase